MFSERTSVGLDVHARSVVAAAIDGVTGEVFRARLTPGHGELLRDGENEISVAVANELRSGGPGRAAAARGGDAEVSRREVGSKGACGAGSNARMRPRASLVMSVLDPRRRPFGAAVHACGAVASSTQGCHGKGVETLRGHRVTACGAAPVAASPDPVQGGVDVAEGRLCCCSQREMDLHPSGVGPRLQGDGVQLPQLLNPEAPLRSKDRSRVGEEFWAAVVRARARDARAAPARLVGGSLRPSLRDCVSASGAGGTARWRRRRLS